MHRRRFLQGATLLGITPFVTSAFPFLSEVQTNAAPLTSSPTPKDVKDSDTVLFTVDGWDPLTAESQFQNAVAIRVNQSWRSAWR